MTSSFPGTLHKTMQTDRRKASVGSLKQAPRSALSFYTEVMLLVACLLLTLIVLVPFFTLAYNTGRDAKSKTAAIVYTQDISAFYTSAQDDAEFSALLEGYSYKESLEVLNPIVATVAVQSKSLDTADAIDASVPASSSTAQAAWKLTVIDAFDIVLVSSSEPTEAGTMRSLSTMVFKDDESVYELESSKYVSKRGEGTR